MNAPRRFTMIIAVLLLLGAAGSVWGNGTDEQDTPAGIWFHTSDATDLPEVGIIPRASGDVFNIEVTGASVVGGYTYDQSTYRFLYSSDWEIDDADIPAAAVEAGGAETFQLSTEYAVAGNVSATIESGSVSSSILGPPVLPVSIPSWMTPQVLLPGSGLDWDIEIVLFLRPDSQTSSTSFLRLRVVSGVQDFFEGESTLFQEYPDESYSVKAIAFLNHVLEYPDVASPGSGFEEAMRDLLGQSDANLRLFEGQNLEPQVASFRARFARYLRQDLAVLDLRDGSGEIELPTVNLSDSSATLLYGNSRNIYLTGYLTHLYGLDHPKPMLERVYYSTLARHGIPYDYRDYDAMSSTQGDTLAEMALRFLTWGVEYPNSNWTPIAGYQRVFHLAFPSDGIVTAQVEALRNWIVGGPPLQSPATVYYGRVPFDGENSGIDLIGDDLQGNTYFQHLAPSTDGPAATVAGRISTPFWNPDAEAGDPAGLLGYPLPYLEHGIDSPRTFNYKMYERTRAIARLYADPLIFGASPFIDMLSAELTSGQSAIRSVGSQLSGITDLHLSASDIDLGAYVGHVILQYEVGRPAAADIIDHDEAVLAQILDRSGPPRPFEPAGGGRGETPLTSAGIGNHELLMGALAMMYETEEDVTAMSADSVPLAGRFRDYSVMTTETGGLVGATIGEPFVALDDERRPHYLDDPVEAEDLLDLLHQTFAVQRVDIERSTVIVPDISLIRPGDLLVRIPDSPRLDVAAEPELAIVVGMEWEAGTPAPPPGADVRAWWDQVYAVTATEITGTVMMGTWGNGSTVMSSFTQTPGQYHIRRLLVGAGTSAGSPTADAWDLMDTTIDALQMSTAWETDRYTEAESHWVPNTQFETESGAVQYEVLSAERISVWGTNPAGAPVSLGTVQEYTPVVFFQPVDLFLDQEPVDDESYNPASNIYRNQGAGIEIVVQDTQNQWHSVARYAPGDPPGSPMGPEWEQRPQGDSRDGLFVRGGRLVYRRDGVDLTTFGIRAVGPDSAIRPGDDYLLRVGYLPDGGDHIIATAPEQDFVAIYDKKMLWRANLYIDETQGAGLDWNDEHRWTTDDNAWNVVYDWEERGALVELSQLGEPLDVDDPEVVPALSLLDTEGDGGQVIHFPAWTPIRGDVNTPVHAVAYDYPYSWSETLVRPGGTGTDNPYLYDRFLGMDSPFDFTNKLMALRDVMRAIGQAYIDQGATEDARIQRGQVEYLPGVTYLQLSQWEHTTAPVGATDDDRNRWLNYPSDPGVEAVWEEPYSLVGVSDLYIPQMGLFYYAQKIPVDPLYASAISSPAVARHPEYATNGDGLQDTWGVAGTVYGSWSGGSYQLSLTSGEDTYVAYNRPEHVWGTGTDCIGFAQQSATYADHPYAWSSLGRSEIEVASESGEPYYRTYPLTQEEAEPRGRVTMSDVVVDRGTFETLQQSQWPSYLGLIRPGDIMYYYPGHIAIVQDVVWNENGEVADLSSIQLIEATFDTALGNRQYANVTNIRTLETVDGDGKPWRVVRLRTQ